jgi:hypothetical protein
MKTFKELKESGILSDPLGYELRGVAHSDYGTNRLENDQILHRVNVFIEGLLNRPILEPSGMMAQLRAKLNILGYDFNYSTQQIGEGNFSFDVTRHGGSFGTTPDHDLKAGFYQHDGFAGMAVKLEGSVSKSPDGYKIEAKLNSINDGAPD